MTFADFQADLHADHTGGEKNAAFVERRLTPVDDSLALLRNFGASEDEDTLAPVENPFRDVGRNDPCPCGSGKKFKKCCLAKLDEVS